MVTKQFWHTLILACCCILSLSARDGARDVVLTARDLGHTAFHEAVVAADLYKHAKKKPGEDGSMAPFTVFVPTNKAFAALKGVDAKTKKGLITFHVVPGQEVKQLSDIDADGVPTVGEQLLQFDGTTVGLEDSDVRAKVIGGPIAGNNGVIYVIDTVLMPAGMNVPTSVQPAKAKNVAPLTKKADVVQQLQQAHAALTPLPAPRPELQPRAMTAPRPTPHDPSGVTNEQVLNAVTQLTQSVQLLIHVIQQQQTPDLSSQPVHTAAPGVQNVVVQ